MELLKYFLIVLSAVAGILGSFLDLYHENKKGKNRLTKSGYTLIGIIITSIFVASLIQYSENKKNTANQIAQKAADDARIKSLEKISRTLDDSIELNDIIYQGANQFDEFRVWIGYKIELDENNFGQSQDHIPEKYQSLWLKNVLQEGLGEILEKYNEENLGSATLQSGLHLKRKGSYLNSRVGWRIYLDDLQTFKFIVMENRLNKDRLFIPELWKGKDAIFSKKLIVVRDALSESFNEINKLRGIPKFHIVQRSAFFYNEKIPVKTARTSMQSEYERVWAEFPNPIFYQRQDNIVYFDLFTDVVRSSSSMNLDINFNLKDLKKSNLLLQNENSSLEGPGITPLKVKIEAKNIPTHYYKLERFSINGIPDGVDIYKLVLINQKEYEGLSPSLILGRITTRQ